jgi:hypothetical protein
MQIDKTETRVPSETIELERVRLRKLEESDAAAIFELYSDPEVARYLARPALKALSQAEELIGRVHAGYADGSSMQLGIERREDGALMGHCLLFHFHEVPLVCALDKLRAMPVIVTFGQPSPPRDPYALCQRVFRATATEPTKGSGASRRGLVVRT